MKDTIKITLKLAENDFEIEEKMSVIVTILKSLISHLEDTKGNTQSVNDNGELYTMSYQHLIVED